MKPLLHLSLKKNSTSRYMENAQLISRRFQDQPQKPLERAVWWIDYIIRNPTPDHLQSPTLKLGYFASNSYDVILLVVACIFVTVRLILKGIRWLRKPKETYLDSKKTN